MPLHGSFRIRAAAILTSRYERQSEKWNKNFVEKMVDSDLVIVFTRSQHLI